MSNDKGNHEQNADRAGNEERSDKPSTGAVDIRQSETGADVHVGHTPGKAEGVDAPETEGNE